MSYKTNRRGRPAMKNQINMREEIMEYYERNISAAAAARETGHDIKTIYKHYHEFSNVIIESQNTGYVEKKNREVTQHIASIDHMMLQLQQILDNVINEMSKPPEDGKPLPKYRTDDITKIIDKIAGLIERKTKLGLELVIEDEYLKEESVNETLIKEIVQYVINEKYTSNGVCTGNELEQAIIAVTKCEVSQIAPVLNKMNSLGLGICVENNSIIAPGITARYHMREFALMRGYLPDEKEQKRKN